MCVSYTHLGGGVAVSADSSDRDVLEDGLAIATAVAICGVDWADDGEHLGSAVVLIAALPRGHFDVREAGDAAGDFAVGAI